MPGEPRRTDERRLGLGRVRWLLLGGPRGPDARRNLTHRRRISPRDVQAMVVSEPDAADQGDRRTRRSGRPIPQQADCLFGTAGDVQPRNELGTLMWYARILTCRCGTEPARLQTAVAGAVPAAWISRSRRQRFRRRSFTGQSGRAARCKSAEGRQYTVAGLDVRRRGKSRTTEQVSARLA